MISHEWRCIYIHQRKTAGIAIRAAFGFQGMTKTREPDAHAFNNGVLDADWAMRPRNYFVFSSCRNPFSRAVSAWRFLWPRRDVSLVDALTSTTLTPKQWRHIQRPQIDILREGGEWVTDDLVRFESLQSDFNRVCDKIGKRRTVLKKLNSTTGPHYKNAIGPEARAIIEQMFAEDFEFLGYAW